MPTYVYKCKFCEVVMEINHPVAEVDEPSEKLLEMISCPMDRNCLPHIEFALGVEQPTEKDLIFKRVPQIPQIMGMIGGSSLKGRERAETIQQERKVRASEHFKKEIYPTLPKNEKRHFDKKSNERNEK